MEITSHTDRYLIVEDKDSLTPILIWAIILSGTVLPLATIREAGLFSFYRFTYWIGPVLIIGAVIAYMTLVKRDRMLFDRTTQRFRLERRKGFQTFFRQEFGLKDIMDIRIEKQTEDTEEKYRLALSIQGKGWIPLTLHYKRDLSSIQHAGRTIRGFLGI